MGPAFAARAARTGPSRLGTTVVIGIETSMTLPGKVRYIARRAEYRTWLVSQPVRQGTSVWSGGRAATPDARANCAATRNPHGRRWCSEPRARPLALCEVVERRQRPVLPRRRRGLLQPSQTSQNSRGPGSQRKLIDVIEGISR